MSSSSSSSSSGRVSRKRHLEDSKGMNTISIPTNKDPKRQNTIDNRTAVVIHRESKEEAIDDSEPVV
jgi:hypothetical protein